MEFGFKMTHTLELANRDFKVNILIIIQNMKKYMCNKLKVLNRNYK